MSGVIGLGSDIFEMMSSGLDFEQGYTSKWTILDNFSSDIHQLKLYTDIRREN